MDSFTILFAGDSGDGIQFMGRQFAETLAKKGTNISTYSDFPADIRAPKGTIANISSFKIYVGHAEIFKSGDFYNVLVVMNATALKKHYFFLKNCGILIANVSGFSEKNLQKAGYEIDPLKVIECKKIYKIDVLGSIRTFMSCLRSKDLNLVTNMFFLGFIYCMYNCTLDHTEKFIKKKRKFVKTNLYLLRAGYNFGRQKKILRFTIPASNYGNVNISGNKALSLGLIVAASKAKIDLFYASYPITPASDILHYMSYYKKYGVKTFQAEDEISAITSATGASYAGNLGVTGTSGPGMSLTQEGLGLAVMLELPLVIINVQRSGPSTGLPTKTEQSDLLQAIYGRHGEAPIPVFAVKSPAHAFDIAFRAAKTAIEHMSPIILLSDVYLATGISCCKLPNISKLENISPPFFTSKNIKYNPYFRNEKMVRYWVQPGYVGIEHTIGSLEKKNCSGEVSYDEENHQKMVKFRAAKIDFIKKTLPKQILYGVSTGSVLILGWGSTYSSIRSAIKILLDEGLSVAHLHLEYINPLPLGLNKIFSVFKKILVAELNNGQLIHIIRDYFLINAIPLNKIKGSILTTTEIVEIVRNILKLSCL